jgi:hypothetical protein
MEKYKKYWLRRKRLTRASRFSTSNIFSYLGLLTLVGYIFYQLIILNKSLDDKADLTMPLIVMSIFLVLSGLAKIKDKRAIDDTNLRVIRGNEAVRSGIEMAIFGIAMALIVLLWK